MRAVPAALIAAAALAAGLAHAPAHAATAPACDRATAAAVTGGGPFATDLADPLGQVLCGPFLGPGSSAMVVTFRAPTCWPVQGWTVFRAEAGVWREVLLRSAFIVPPLRATASGITVTEPVSRPGDPRCIPSGGTRARTWTWDGTGLVAGPWRRVTAGRPAPVAGAGGLTHFRTPSGNIACDATATSLLCGVASGLRPAPAPHVCSDGGPNTRLVRLGVRGRPAVPACWGDPGPFVDLAGARVLAYGSRWAAGGMACVSRSSGLTCRNPAGHGFVLSRAAYRPF